MTSSEVTLFLIAAVASVQKSAVLFKNCYFEGKMSFSDRKYHFWTPKSRFSFVFDVFISSVIFVKPYFWVRSNSENSKWHMPISLFSKKNLTCLPGSFFVGYLEQANLCIYILEPTVWQTKVHGCRYHRVSWRNASVVTV